MEQTRAEADAEFVRQAVQQFERPLTAYAAHLLRGDVERARDVVQEAFVRLWSEPRTRVEANLRPWLYAVCRNLAIDELRRERRMHPAGERAAPDERLRIHPGPVDAAERAESYGRAMAALRTLSANQQEVIRLRFKDGLSYRQISEVTGLSITNVGFLIHTGLKAVRQRMGEPADGDEREGTSRATTVRAGATDGRT